MTDQLTQKIGEKIRTLRKERGYTLKMLSEKTGISTPMLSKVENAQTLPPTSTYANIASGLGISLGDLFQDDEQEPDFSIVRSEDRQIISNGPYIGSPLAYPKKNKKMEPFLFEYPNGGKFPRFQHDNEEMIYIIHGELEFKYGEKIVVLSKGDCIYFNGKVPHGGRALNDEGVQAIIVQSTS